MVNVVYLSPGENMRDRLDGEPWVIVEANHDGRFFGTGWSRNGSRANVGYISLVENDVSLDASIAAAVEWAKTHGVPTVFVQPEPWNLHSD